MRKDLYRKDGLHLNPKSKRLRPLKSEKKQQPDFQTVKMEVNLMQCRKAGELL